MIEVQYSIFCDGITISNEECENEFVEWQNDGKGKTFCTKTRTIKNARKEGWSIGKNHLCPACVFGKRKEREKI